MKKRNDIKQKLYYFIIGYQVLSFIFTIINLIYCFISTDTTLFPFSISGFFIPQYYITYGGGLWNIIPLMILILITSLLFVKSSKEFLNPNPNSGKFIALNIFWLCFMYSYFLVFFMLHMSSNPQQPYTSILNLFISVVFIYIYIIAMFCKVKYYEIAKNNMKIKCYRQIKNNAISASAIAIFSFLLTLSMHYYSDMPLSNPKNHDLFSLDKYTIGVFIIISIILFVYNNISFFTLKKDSKEKLPCKHFLLKLNILQILSIILSLLFSCITVFVIF